MDRCPDADLQESWLQIRNSMQDSLWLVIHLNGKYLERREVMWEIAVSCLMINLLVGHSRMNERSL